MRSRPTWEPFSKNRRTVIMSARSEEHTSELQSQSNLVCRLLLEKKKKLQTLRNVIITTDVPAIITFQYDAGVPSSLQWQCGVQMPLPCAAALDLAYVVKHDLSRL